MQEEIYNKLHTALYLIAPLASDRDRIIEEMGETIWLESLQKTLLALEEGPRNQVIALLNEDKLDDAVSVLESHNVDIDAIVSEVATSVMDEVVAVGTQEK